MSMVLRCRTSTLPMKTYFTFTMVQTSVAPLEFNTIKKINTTTLVGAQRTRTIQTNISKIKDDNVDEEVDEVAQANEEVHVVGDDESSADDNFDIFGHDVQHDESKEESVYKSTEEDNTPINDPAKDPVEDRQRLLMVRQLDPGLDGNRWESTGSHMVSAMMVAEQAGVRMMKEYFEIESSKATPQYGFRKG